MNKSITCTISCQSNSYSCVVLTKLLILQFIMSLKKSNVHQAFELHNVKTTNCWCQLTFKKIGLNTVL